ncbi:MAG TPA: sensor histidine kinase [Steroidobacteraceae bacterium]|nr:sensor histidine kinase [Steroidobacteraceae bacterium]
MLLLHSFGPEFGDLYARDLRIELGRELAGHLELYEDWLVSARFMSSAGDTAFADYLRTQFADRPLDLVITLGAPAANFVQRYQQSLFRSTPELLTDVEERRASPSSLASNETALAVSVSFPAVVANILRVLPDTRTLAIVIGNSPIEGYWATQIRDSLRPFSGRINLAFLNGLSFDQLLQRVATLPPHSAIFYVLLSPDVDGIPQDEDAALARLHAVADAPMFSYSDAYLGKGIVGGPLVSGEEQGREAVAIATRLLRGEPASDIRYPPVGFGKPQFDERELERWNIKEANLPPDSTILFREATVWERYRWQIALIAVALALQMALIIDLLQERRRRRLAEIEAHQRIAELAHMNRRSTVGELSASIAHELMQPLSAILSNTETAGLLLDAPSPDIRELKEILTDIGHDQERATEVIKRLRRLLTKAPSETQEFDLNGMVREVLALLGAQATAQRVTLGTSFAPRELRVRGDRIQLQQVILNLVMNAIEAMVAAQSPQRTIVLRTAWLEGDLAEITLEDSGPGIAFGKTEQIFEPFYTTKESGMGMGLSIARTIIESHGGRIWAETDAGRGAVFRFTLPLADTVRASGPAPAEKDASQRPSIPTVAPKIAALYP